MQSTQEKKAELIAAKNQLIQSKRSAGDLVKMRLNELGILHDFPSSLKSERISDETILNGINAAIAAYTEQEQAKLKPEFQP